ncbi:MAG: hypothetical protein IK099_07700 [Clostridia bacterium]|nr:hypothetical protein [Clostridia bacterium]
MIFALAMNPCWDKTARIARFRLDAPNRIQAERTDVGGRGVDVARAAKELGGEAELIGFDFAGEPVKQAMEREHIASRLYPLPCDMRVRLNLRETDTGRTVEISEPGVTVRPDDLKAVLYGMLEAAVTGAWFVLSGSLPPGAPPDTYGRFCAAVQAWNCPVAVDCGGEALTEAVKAKPALLHTSVQEFCRLTGADPENETDALYACRRLCFQGVKRLCLAWGEKGAWLVSAKGAWACGAAKAEAGGSQRGGDAFLAALLIALSQGMADPEALRFASAAAALARAGAPLCRREIDALVPGLSACPLGG